MSDMGDRLYKFQLAMIQLQCGLPIQMFAEEHAWMFVSIEKQIGYVLSKEKAGSLCVTHWAHWPEPAREEI